MEAFQRGQPYFAYGSNMCVAWLQRDAPKANAIGKAVLGDWDLVFQKRSRRDGSAKADVAVAGGSVVWGGLFQLADKDLDGLNEKEGGYRPRELVVHVDGHDEKSWTYVGREVEPARPLVPWDWYIRLMLAGAQYFGLPDWYVARLARVPVLIDVDAKRIVDAEAALKMSVMKVSQGIGIHER